MLPAISLSHRTHYISLTPYPPFISQWVISMYSRMCLESCEGHSGYCDRRAVQPVLPSLWQEEYTPSTHPCRVSYCSLSLSLTLPTHPCRVSYRSLYLSLTLPTYPCRVSYCNLSLTHSTYPSLSGQLPQSLPCLPLPPTPLVFSPVSPLSPPLSHTPTSRSLSQPAWCNTTQLTHSSITYSSITYSVLRTPVLRTPVLRTPVLRTPVLRTPVLRTLVLRTEVWNMQFLTQSSTTETLAETVHPMGSCLLL